MSKNTKVSLDLRPKLSWTHCGVEMEQYIGNLKKSPEVPIIDLPFD